MDLVAIRDFFLTIYNMWPATLLRENRRSITIASVIFLLEKLLVHQIDQVYYHQWVRSPKLHYAIDIFMLKAVRGIATHMFLVFPDLHSVGLYILYSVVPNLPADTINSPTPCEFEKVRDTLILPVFSEVSLLQLWYPKEVMDSWLSAYLSFGH